MATPLSTPAEPLGAKGTQLDFCTEKSPQAMTKTTTASLTMTMAALARALSRMP